MLLNFKKDGILAVFLTLTHKLKKHERYHQPLPKMQI